MAVGPAATPVRDRHFARTALLPVAVVLLLGAVALASRAPLRPPRATPLGTPAIGKGGSVSPWTLLLVGIGAAIMLASLALNLIWTRGREVFPRPKRSMLSQVALVMLLLGGVLVVSGLRGHRGAGFQGGPGHGALAGRARAAPPSFHFPLWAQLTVGVLVLLAAVLTASALGRRWRAADAPSPPPLARRKITDAIDRSLEDLENDPDARRAIIAAYRRMEESLANVGLPRGGSETAREYLSRGLASLELSPGAIGTLTTLFERAKFSLRHVDLRLRDEAIAALRALHQELAGA